MNISSLSLGPLGTNCYIVSKNNEAIIFDPGGEANKVITFLKNNDLTPIAILLTHTHFDHIGAVDQLRTYYNIDVYTHQNESHWLEEPELNRSFRFIGQEIRTPKPEHILKPGYLSLATFNFEVIHTPGHSPGSVSFVFHNYQFVISGDVLFLQGVGRTDLPGGDSKELQHSIRNKLYLLPDSFTIYPGHGTKTNIGYEKKNNLYVPEN